MLLVLPISRIHHAREREQQVRQPIEVDYGRLVGRGVVSDQCDGPALCPPADRARVVQRRTRPRATGEDEVLEWIEFLRVLVYHRLEGIDVVRPDRRVVLVGLGVGEVRLDDVEVVLDSRQGVVDVVVAGGPDDGS